MRMSEIVSSQDAGFPILLESKQLSIPVPSRHSTI